MTAAVDEYSRGDNSSSGSRRRCRTGHTGLGWLAGASHSPVRDDGQNRGLRPVEEEGGGGGGGRRIRLK